MATSPSPELPRFDEREPPTDDDGAPNMVCWVYTHPSGLSRPSDGDVEFGTERELSYDAWCGDYEFFHVIHGLGDTVRIGHPLSGSDTVRPEEVRQPEQTDVNEVSWVGETREHTLAVYDKEFDPRPVEVLSAADMQRPDATVGFQPGPDSQSGSEPGGEIWD